MENRKTIALFHVIVAFMIMARLIGMSEKLTRYLNELLLSEMFVGFLWIGYVWLWEVISQKPVLLGVGGPKSGKFVMISLLRYIFHNYALLIPNDILSSQLTKYSLLPKEMRLFFVDGVRFLDKANVLGLEKMINEISKDRISDRKVFMTTRNLPEGIVNNQIEVVNFESRFQIDPGYEVSTFEADRDLLNKLGILSSAFLWMCLTRRKVLEVKPRLITYLALEEGCPYNILESLDSFL